MGKFRKLFSIICLVLVIAFIVAYFYKRNHELLAIDVQQVNAGEAQLVLAVVGRVRTKDIVNVRVEYPGKVIRLLVDEGDQVKQGDTIAEVRSASQQAAFLVAEAELQAVKAQLEFAQKDFERLSELSKKGLVANITLDQARTTLASTKAKLRASQEARKKALIQVNDFIIQSPLNGIVLTRPIDQGQVVSVNDVLFQLGSDGPIEIEAEVDEIYASELNVDMKAILVPTGKQKKAIGRITEISPRVNPLNGSRLTRLMLNDSDEDFVPGRSIDVNILVKSFDKVLSVPRSALKKEGDTWFVYTVIDNEVKPNAVTFVDWPGSFVILETGIKSGALVALDATVAATAFVDGQHVSATKVKP
ncbi:efflux RND transporter periplasmic adaptor subunit [Thalassotalea piscium]